jgi:hypothetical protein
MTAQAAAGPRKVLVLPIDGNADPAIRAKLTASIQKLARVIDGQVQPGDATFADTAAAVGCDPATPACAETVRTTLGVDEVVYGTATAQGTQVTVVVKRKVKDRSPKEQSATFAQTAPSKAEPALLPLFTGTVEDDPETAVEPDPVTPPQPEPEPVVDTPPPPPPPVRAPRSRKWALGIGSIVGGSALLLTGLALWSSASGTQDEIDRSPTNTLQELRALKQLEDQAASRALVGNLCVLAGLGLGVLGGYLLYQDRKERRVTITPAPIPGGAAVFVEIRGAR